MLTLTLDPVIQINRVPPLIIYNFYVKFESDWAKTRVCIVPTRFYAQTGLEIHALKLAKCELKFSFAS